MRVKIGKERVLKSTAKHTVKVHVWAGISKRGATNNVIMYVLHLHCLIVTKVRMQ